MVSIKQNKNSSTFDMEEFDRMLKRFFNGDHELAISSVSDWLAMSIARNAIRYKAGIKDSAYIIELCFKAIRQRFDLYVKQNQ